MTDRWRLAQVCGSVTPRMSVAGSPRRSPSCRWNKRHRPGADWWGPPVRFIVDQGCGYLFTCFGFSLLVVVLWCVGNPDLCDRGLVCFWGTFLCGLFTPTNPLPGHRFVSESHYLTSPTDAKEKPIRASHLLRVLSLCLGWLKGRKPTLFLWVCVGGQAKLVDSTVGIG